MATDKNEPIQEFKLEPNSELRIIAKLNKTCKVTLKAGFAEVFGTELVQGQSYEFTSRAKIAIFSWEGCVLEIRGCTDKSFLAKRSPMMTYKKFHNTLEEMRILAERSNKKGPVCMVVGPCDVGKSTIVKILLNYAVRMGRTPIYVDLDVGQGQISVPGTIGAISIKKPASIEEGFLHEDPLIYHFGHYTSSKNTDLFRMLLIQLGNNIKDKLEVDKKTKMSGVIINTCGWVQGEGFKHILHTSNAFEADVILVVSQETLYNNLCNNVHKSVRVDFVCKSGGVVERPLSERFELRKQKIHEYFYGTIKNSLYPHSFDIKWDDIKIFKINALNHLSKLQLLSPNPCMLHHLLAVSLSDKEVDLILSQCAGYICVTNVDSVKQTFTVLSTQPKPLSNNLLLLSELKFVGERTFN